ncbi:hypothetical protein LCGC14_1423980 [marine sediment metagenome]|uniref:Phage Gp37Gp68 family protein n=1 Tax=marine sediment metagenome TaxID=412755 RepID=A0A0F9MS88_9ZZZZ
MSKIEWTGETWNPVLGCSKVSAGCENCYALRDSWRQAHHPKQVANYEGLTKKVGGKVQWTGKIRCIPDRLSKPLDEKKPTTYFVNSMSDLFHEGVPDEFIDQVFAVMALCPQHTFQILTKRPERMAEYFSGTGVAPRGIECPTKNHVLNVADRIAWRNFPRQFERLEQSVKNGAFKWPIPNVWLGVSVEDQATADERIPHLLNTPAAVRFVSYEPALGPGDFALFLDGPRLAGKLADMIGGDVAAINDPCSKERLDWIIAGGESGPGARVCEIENIRSVVRQCRDAGVAVFVKQLGANPHYKKPNGRPLCMARKPCGHGDWARSVALEDHKGGNWDEWPEDLRVREMPKAAGRLLDGREHNGMPVTG